MWWRWTPAAWPILEIDAATLRQRIEEARAKSDRIVAAYKPGTTADLGALDAKTIAAILGSVDAQWDITVHVPSGLVSNAIIHLRDWHFVPRDELAVDLRNQYGRGLSEADIDRLYAAHLADVEVVQFEQMALLRCLIRHHSLTTIFIEGMTEDHAALRAVIESLRQKIGSEKQLRGQRRDVEAIKDQRGAKELLIEIDALLEQSRREQLAAGAALRLVATGEVKEMLPLDDKATHQAANPVREGRLQPDPDKIAKRREAIVRNALSRKVAVIILGGSHDLTEHIDRITGGRGEYIRVATKGYPGE